MPRAKEVSVEVKNSSEAPTEIGANEQLRRERIAAALRGRSFKRLKVVTTAKSATSKTAASSPAVVLRTPQGFVIEGLQVADLERLLAKL